MHCTTRAGEQMCCPALRCTVMHPEEQHTAHHGALRCATLHCTARRDALLVLHTGECCAAQPCTALHPRERRAVLHSTVQREVLHCIAGINALPGAAPKGALHCAAAQRATHCPALHDTAP